jgi:predicted aspartyl protease
VYIAKNRSIKAKVTLHIDGKQADTEALLDSGATENLINPRMVKKYRFPIQLLKRKRRLFNVDGTLNKQGEITSIAMITIRSGNHYQTHRFLIADIGIDDLILGYPFLEATNPLINCKDGTIDKTVHLFIPQKWKDIFSKWKGWTPTDELANKVTMAQQLAEQATDKKERTWQEQVPKQYHRHGKVFSKQASERFPSKRPWDHAIDLKMDAPISLDCRTYPLAPKEKEEQKKFLEANLRLQRIQ